MTFTWPRVLDAIALSLLFLASSLVYPTLPPRIPTHFGFDGTPDAWSATTLRAWFALPAVALVLALAIHALPAFLADRPGLVHLLDGRDLGAVPASQRPIVLARIRDLMDWIAFAVTVSMALLQGAVHRAALGHGVSGMLLVLLLLGPFLLALVVLFTRRIDGDLRRSGTPR